MAIGSLNNKMASAMMWVPCGLSGIRSVNTFILLGRDPREKRIHVLFSIYESRLRKGTRRYQECMDTDSGQI